MKKNKKITTEEIKEAIFHSGYLLEQRVENVLEKNGYYVSANTAYLDPLTGKSREVDIEAIAGIKLSRNYDFLYINLICECENNQQPAVFFIKDSPVSFLNYQELKAAGIPVQFLEKDFFKKHGIKIEEDEQFTDLSDFLNLERYHHYCKGHISTQYCTFTQKKDKTAWIAFHSEEQHDSFTNLILALESKIDEYYKDYVLPGKDEEECANIQIYYPVLILQGLLYSAEIKRNQLALKKCGHVQYRKEYFSRDKHDTYQIDVITESFLPKYLKIIETESERMKNRLKRNSKIVRESLDRLMEIAKKKSSKESFKDIFHY